MAKGAYDAGPLVARASASTVGSLFAAQARLFPDRVAVVDGGPGVNTAAGVGPPGGLGGRNLTYGALATRVRRLAGALAARGVGRGARVAILSENRAEYLELF